MSVPRRLPWARLLLGGGLALGVALGAAFWPFYDSVPEPRADVPIAAAPPTTSSAEATREQVTQLCGTCHAFPPPAALPRSEWKTQVTHGFEFALQAGMKLRDAPPRLAVQAYYERHAPVELAWPARAEQIPSPVRFERRDFSLQGPPAISHVRFVHFSDERKLDLLACDMFEGRILRLRPYDADPRLEVLCEGLGHPAHLEVVDLDGDGVKDVLVANLGEYFPTNKKCGSLTWLRGSKGGRFTPHTLLEGVGRIADARAADLNGDGRLDLVVAVFGWRWTGEVLYLQNLGTDPPSFETRVLDGRHGSIHVPIADIDADGKLDIVVLTSQEHETVVAFLGDGRGNFSPKTLFAGPHPAFGSTGIQLVDLNRDGRLDILYSNGDSLDSLVLRPYHGVRWLENPGPGAPGFPFVEHHLAPLCGVTRAVAADLEGRGMLDVLAVSMLPANFFREEARTRRLDSILLLCQEAPGRFSTHLLESVTCDHTTCDVGDFDGDGRIDFATGSFVNLGEQTADVNATGPVPWVTLWRNVGKR